MTAPIPPPAPSNFLGTDPSSLPGKIGIVIVGKLAGDAIRKLAGDVWNHPMETCMATSAAIGSVAGQYFLGGVCIGSAGPAGVLFGITYYTLSRLLPPPEAASQQTKDYQLITEMFSEKCGGIADDIKLQDRTRDALFRARQGKDPLYEKYEKQFFQCVHSKV